MSGIERVDDDTVRLPDGTLVYSLKKAIEMTKPHPKRWTCWIHNDIEMNKLEGNTYFCPECTRKVLPPDSSSA